MGDEVEKGNKRGIMVEIRRITVIEICGQVIKSSREGAGKRENNKNPEG